MTDSSIETVPVLLDRAWVNSGGPEVGRPFRPPSYLCELHRVRLGLCGPQSSRDISAKARWKNREPGRPLPRTSVPEAAPYVSRASPFQSIARRLLDRTLAKAILVFLRRETFPGKVIVQRQETFPARSDVGVGLSCRSREGGTSFTRLTRVSSSVAISTLNPSSIPPMSTLDPLKASRSPLRSLRIAFISSRDLGSFEDLAVRNRRQ